MAESNLSVTYSDLEVYVARFAGWNPDTTQWTSDQETDFGLILRKGIRRFYFPPPPEPNQPLYEWSFLRRDGSLPLLDGTYAYELPDDFAGVIVPGSMAYAAGTDKTRPEVVPVQQIMALRGKLDLDGDPKYYAIRVKEHNAASGQRWEVVFYPTPDAAATLTYRYVCIPNAPDSNNIYPMGGAAHSELIIESVLAAAEEHLDDDNSGIHNQKFAQMMSAAIRLDQEAKTRIG